MESQMNNSTKSAADYFCVITGPIGVGKTTIYNLLARELQKSNDNLVKIREYIDGKNNYVSDYLLGMYLNGNLSDACFQNYIQSYYIDELMPEKLNNKIVLMERCMSDSVSIFCNLANSRKKLSDIDFAIMYNNCKNEDLKVSAPNYFIKNFEFSLITTNVHPEISVKEIMNIIEKDLASGIKSRVIGLINDTDICYNRMVERARGSETSYKKIDIERNCFAYQQLYEMIQNPDYQEIRLFDLGRLLQYK